MRIAMANDHAGYSLKLEIKQQLEADGHEVVDFGTHDELLHRSELYGRIFSRYDMADEEAAVLTGMEAD